MAGQPSSELPEESTGFLSLPRELRDIIYDFTLTTSDKVYLCTGDGQRGNCLVSSEDDGEDEVAHTPSSTPYLRTIYSLLNVSHQVRIEVQETISTHDHYVTALVHKDHWAKYSDRPVCAVCLKISPYISEINASHCIPHMGWWLHLQRDRDGHWSVRYDEELDDTFSLSDNHFPVMVKATQAGIEGVLRSMGTQLGIFPDDLARIERVSRDVDSAWYRMVRLAAIAALRAERGKEVSEADLRDEIDWWFRWGIR